jgi:uncharacterized membrane protein YkvA (DUF1232 family)
MSFFVKIILIIFAFAYFISPVDLIPDLLLPFIGWIDDTAIAGIVFYLIRYGKLPNLTVMKNKFFNSNKNATDNSTDKDSESDPYEILEISMDSTKEEVQAAYKKLVKQYHPDKVSHLGKDLQKVANEKFIKIKNAYDTLMKKL